MAATSFQLVDNQTFLPADVSAGAVYVSPEQENGVGNDLSTGIQVVVDYHDLQSAIPAAALQAVVEGKSDRGQFYTVAYQPSEFSTVGVQQRRQIIMSQDFITVRQGAEEEVGISGVVTDRIYRQHGVMPHIWRVRVSIRDLVSSFISVRMSIYGWRFNSLISSESTERVVTDISGRPLTDAGKLITAQGGPQK